MSLLSVERLREIENKATPESGHPLVMIVDDEALNRGIVSNILNHSYRTLEVPNGEEAWSMICSMENPSELACIIIDLHMPKMTGLELLRQVRNAYPKIARVVITANADVDAVVEAIHELDVYKFIVRPYKDSDFVLTIRRAVQAFEMQCELDNYHAKLEEMVHTRTQKLTEMSAELERIMHLLRQNRAYLAIQSGETESWRSCFCAIMNDDGEIAYAEHGFEQLMRKQWEKATISCLPSQLIDFLGNDNDKFTTTSLVACKQKIENSWFLWLRKALPVDGLTVRELDVTGLVAAGLTHKEIAKRLKIAPATVRSHLQRLHDKLDVKTNAELVVKCFS